MLEESAQVLTVTREGVWVETVRQSACGQCSAAKGCGQKMLASIGQGQRFEVLADNPRRLILQAGDRVVLGLAETAFLKASALAYLLPLVAMIVAAVIAEFIGVSEGGVAVAGLAGLGCGLVVTKLLVSTRSQECQYRPTILRVSEAVASTPS